MNTLNSVSKKSGAKQISAVSQFPITRQTKSLSQQAHNSLVAMTRLLLGFCSAFNLTLCGAVLKYFGSDWLLPGIFFGFSLGFLLLWRPRELAVSGGQPA